MQFQSSIKEKWHGAPDTWVPACDCVCVFMLLAVINFHFACAFSIFAAHTHTPPSADMCALQSSHQHESEAINANEIENENAQIRTDASAAWPHHHNNYCHCYCCYHHCGCYHRNAEFWLFATFNMPASGWQMASTTAHATHEKSPCYCVCMCDAVSGKYALLLPKSVLHKLRHDMCTYTPTHARMCES